MNYYEKQLDALNIQPGENLAIQITNGEKQTKWLTLGNESAQAIINFLSNNFIDN